VFCGQERVGGIFRKKKNPERFTGEELPEGRKTKKAQARQSDGKNTEETPKFWEKKLWVQKARLKVFKKGGVKKREKKLKNGCEGIGRKTTFVGKLRNI